MDFYPGAGEEDDLLVESVGIWLPLGFSYVAGSSNLEDDPFVEYCSVIDYAGGQAVVWGFSSENLTYFSGVGLLDFPQSTEITFEYTADTAGARPVTISWIETSGDVSDVPLAWDIDTRIFGITSAAGNTEIEAYASRCELRKMDAAIAGDYHAIGNSLMQDNYYPYTRRDTLLAESTTELDDIPNDPDGDAADVIAAYLYWSGWIASGYTTAISPWPDTCGNFDNWNRDSDDGSQTRVPTADGDVSGTWNTAPVWDDVDETSPNDSDYVTGVTDGGGYQLFTFSSFSIPASSIVTNITVYVRARDASSGTNNIRPALKVNGAYYTTTFSGDNPGGSFSTYSYSYITNPNTEVAWTIADINGTGANHLQQFGVYSSDLNPDVQISMVYAQVNYVSDSVWSIYSGEFRGHAFGSSTTAQRTLTMKDGMDLSGYSSGSIVVEWDQRSGGTLESSDGLQFQFSGDGGTNWSELLDAFMDDTSSEYYHYVVPDEYLTSQFKMRFYLADMSGSNEYAYIDNFAVAQVVGTADTTATFKINGTQVYLDGGEPRQGVQEITATSAQVIGNKNRGEYSYASFLDVTELVQEYAEVVNDEYHTGNAEYTVGSVNADTGTEWSYAGWSLIVIYSSPATAGHQLYLFDTFAFSGGNENLDFDYDGEPGGDISGFVVPEPIEGEVNAGVVTVFIGEGDDNYTGDYFKFNGTALSDGYTTSNVWNSRSVGMSEPGVDIDTFYVTWASGLLAADDTEAHIDLPTATDNWNLVYMVPAQRDGHRQHHALRDTWWAITRGPACPPIGVVFA